MASADRKLRRKKRREAEKDMEEKLGLFELLPEECSACLSPYDKTDLEMVSSWNVVVREKEKVVRLYCSECWEKAKNLIREVDGQDV